MIENTQDKTTPMWRWQGWFQGGATKVAEEVFNRLDDKLRPRLFLLGIPKDEAAPLCLEPADECGYTAAFFQGVRKLAEGIEAAEAAKAFSVEQRKQEEKPKISAKSFQEAIERTLNQPESEYVSYCASPVHIGEYEVFCILQLDVKAFHSYFSLPVESRLNTRIARSLLDATAMEFLNVCTRVLRDPKAGLDINDPLGREPEEILRMGGRALMFTATHAGSYEAFEAMNQLSWKTHEGELAGGELYFFHWDNYHLEMPVEFAHPPDLSDIGAARKLIEMAKIERSETANGTLHLVSTGHSIDGIGFLRELENEFDTYNSEVFVVEFTGYYSWQLRHKEGGVMMQVINGVPSLPGDPFGKEKFIDHVRRIFKESSPDEEALWQIVRSAAKQKHGTMIAISSTAAEEADRLAEQSTDLKNPIRLNDNETILLMLTSIDGAVLIDHKGVCHAAGVILDGNAVKGKGTRSRGARYNSAIRYVNAKKQTGCLAVVISQDGAIDLVPELQPRIRRSDIVKRMEELRGAVASEVVNAKAYYKVIFWLSEHRFYLSQQLCDEINEIKNTATSRLNEQRGTSVTPADFKADEEMNDTYFLDEVTA